MQSRFCSARRRLRLLRLSGLFLVLAPALLCAQESSLSDADQARQAAPGAPVTVQGIVINAATGAALPRALVRVDGSEVLAALTTSDGHFAIDGVPAGAHAITIEKPGFQPFAEPGDTAESAGHAIVAAARMPPLTLSLSPLNAIRVHLTLSTGVPASTIELALFRQTVTDGRHIWVEDADYQTDPSGELRFHGLSDGAYLLSTLPEYGNAYAREPDCGPAAPSMMPGFASVFLPSATESSVASPIHVSGGQTADAAFELEPASFYLVRIAVAGAPASGDQKFALHLNSRSGELLPYNIHQDKDHALCAYLPNGSYTVTVQATNDAGDLRVPNTPQSPPASFFGSLDFSVDGAPLPGLQLALVQTAPTAIHFHYEPAPPKPPAGDQDEEEGDPLEITAAAAHSVQPRDANVPEANAAANGTYSFGPMAPGSYWIHAEAGQTGVCLGTVEAGGEDLSSAPWVVGPSGSGPPIDAVLRTDCAQLKLVLPLGASGESPGDDSPLYLYAVPLFPSLQDAESAQIQPVSQRTAELDDLTPGAYRILLFHSPRSLAFREPAALDALGPGQDITLQPGDHQTLTLTGPEP